MVPDATKLIMELDLTLPLLGVYDAPETGGFGPLVGPEPGKHMCIFCFFENFRKGETLVINPRQFRVRRGRQLSVQCPDQIEGGIYPLSGR